MFFLLMIAGVKRGLIVLKRSLLTAFMLSVICNEARAKDPLISVAEEFLEGQLITALVLTDSDLISLGFADFDPNNYVPLHRTDIGSSETVANRQSIKVNTIPWSFKLQEKDLWQNDLILRLSSMEISSDVQLYTDTSIPKDSAREQIFDIYFASSWSKKINASWRFGLTGGMHYMYYRNRFFYNSESSKILSPILDNLIFNTYSSAVVLEPKIGIQYRGQNKKQPWRFHSTLNYSLGKSIDSENDQLDAQPEFWRLASEIQYFWVLPWLSKTHQIKSFVRRIDLGADASEIMKAKHYYETGVGWLLKTKGKVRWIDNIGVGLSLNIGSALSGGGILLLLNEDAP